MTAIENLFLIYEEQDDVYDKKGEKLAKIIENYSYKEMMQLLDIKVKKIKI